MNVVHFHRKPLPGQHSIEGLFESVRGALHDMGVMVEEKKLPWVSKRIIPRLRSVFWAGRNQGDVNHITGDIHFIALGLKRKRTILTIHDLASLERSRGIKRAILKLFWFDLPLRNVALVTVISEATRRELCNVCAIDAAKVVVVPDAVSRIYQPCPRAFDTTCPEILQIGTKRNKNLSKLFEAIEGLPCRLHLVGHPTEAQREELAQRDITYRVSANLTDTEIYKAYCDADLVTLVSTVEGFGMPILEAQWVERPVVTSNYSSMPEVAGDGACFVNPLDTHSIRTGLQAIMQDAEYRTKLVEAGRINRERFSLEHVASLYLEAYQSVVRTSS